MSVLLSTADVESLLHVLSQAEADSFSSEAEFACTSQERDAYEAERQEIVRIRKVLRGERP